MNVFISNKINNQHQNLYFLTKKPENFSLGESKQRRLCRNDEKTGDEKTGRKYKAEIGKIDGALKKWRKNRNDEKTGDEKTGFYCILFNYSLNVLI